MNNASLFKQVFSPFTGKYIFQQPEAGLFDYDGCSDWITAERPLTDPRINTAILGKAVIGYFLSVCARSFCVDIDDHAGKGPGYLLSVYQTVVGKLRQYPSLVCKTPRGLHAFYFLDHHVPEVLLVMKAKEALHGVPVEVRPTENIGLRIPAEPDLLDPRTWEARNARFKDAVNAAPVYHPVELFGMDVLPGNIVETLKERQGKAVKAQTWKSIACAEAEYGAYGIQGGTTNAVLCELIPVYRSAGLTPEEAAAEFASLFSPDYRGELRRSPRRLLQRVKAFYKNTPTTRFNTLPKEAGAQPLAPDLFTELIAEAIAALVTGPAETVQQRGALTKRRRTIKKAVILIERWKLYIGNIVSRKEFLEMWNYLYPYFKKNTKEGYIPLSRNLFKRMHEHYEKDVLPFLLKIGYLERSPYKYSSVYGICYYYRINGFKFITDKPQPVPPRVRHAKAKARAAQIRAYKQEHPKATVRHIGEVFHISKSSVSDYLRGK